MGVNDRLRALDEKAAHAQRPGAWARSTRHWWFDLALSIAMALGVALWDVRALAFIAIPTAFSGGFFYNERLRHLGRRSLVPGFRAPEHPAAPGDASYDAEVPPA